MIKKIIATILVMVFLVSAIKPWKPNDYFQIIFFDVGQGDAAFIITPKGKTILIDGGPDAKALRQLDGLLPFWKREIDLLIVSHAHDDHFLGLIPIAKRFRIKEIIYGNSNNQSESFKYWQELINLNKKKQLASGEKIAFNFEDNCHLEIENLSDALEEDENDYSLFSTFSCLGRNVLLSGDASERLEARFTSLYPDLKVDIFKAAHHGSKTANSLSFLANIKPGMVVISVGALNKFKHPSWEALANFELLAVDIYRTDQLGLQHFLANNKYIRIIK